MTPGHGSGAPIVLSIALLLVSHGPEIVHLGVCMYVLVNVSAKTAPHSHLPSIHLYICRSLAVAWRVGAVCAQPVPGRVLKEAKVPSTKARTHPNFIERKR